jgi:hypothetical protein
MKKAPYVSHYLVLKDLINGIDVREKNDVIFYLTSRIENIKCDLVKNGIEFVEDISKETSYSHYKPYILKPTEKNILKAKKLLERFASKEVLNFLEFGKIANYNQKQNPTKKIDR